MAYQGIDHTPLLPASVRHRLRALAAAGYRFQRAHRLVWPAASRSPTWSAADPSLSHVTSGSIRNPLGPLGAILADLLMQRA